MWERGEGEGALIDLIVGLRRDCEIPLDILKNITLPIV